MQAVTILAAARYCCCRGVNRAVQDFNVCMMRMAVHSPALMT